MSVQQEQLAKLGPWTKGMNNLLPAESLPADALRNVVNYDVDDDGRLQPRTGKTSIYSGNIQKGSLWTGAGMTLFVEDGDLKRLNTDYSADTLLASVGDTPITYLELNNEVYFSNAIQTGKIIDGKYQMWGVPVPIRNPACTAAASGGSLNAGVYQVAITQISDTNEESGALVPETVTIVENGKIDLTNFPNADLWCNVYCSSANGEELYLVDTLWPGVTQYSITDVSDTTRILDTVNAVRPMAADLLAYYNGRIYLAADNVVYYTDPLRYGLVRPATNFYLFPTTVTVMLDVVDGMYFCADQTYFLTGVDTQDFLQRPVLPYGGVTGTGEHVTNSDAVYWFSPRGFVLGGPSGQAQNLSEDMVAVSAFAQGASMLREYAGKRQLIMVLSNGVENYHVAEDYRTAETTRRGNFK